MKQIHKFFQLKDLSEYAYNTPHTHICTKVILNLQICENKSIKAFIRNQQTDEQHDHEIHVLIKTEDKKRRRVTGYRKCKHTVLTFSH